MSEPAADAGRPPRRTRRRLLRLALILVVLVLVANLQVAQIVPIALGLEPLIHTYSYVSSDGGFEDFECAEKGRDFSLVEAEFAAYRPGRPDIVLCRTFHPSWWRFWNWWEYMTHRRWSYPYRPPDEVVSKDR